MIAYNKEIKNKPFGLVFVEEIRQDPELWPYLKEWERLAEELHEVYEAGDKFLDCLDQDGS